MCSDIRQYWPKCPAGIHKPGMVFEETMDDVQILRMLRTKYAKSAAKALVPTLDGVAISTVIISMHT